MTLSSTSAERFARRARRRQWVLVGRTLGVVVVLAAIGGVAWLVLVSDVLGVRRVEVAGNVVLAEERVRAAADVPAGTPMARVDTSAVAARVGELRWVARADVHRSWPHTLRVRVVEHTTEAVVTDGERFALVDSGGVVFARVLRRPAGVPVVDGDLSRYSRRTLGAVAGVLESLPRGLEQKVVHVSARTIDSVVLSLQDGTRVMWGSAEQGTLKARVLRGLMAHEARVYDVSAPHAPAVRQ